MENRGLLFIPDISGFTRFVNETEIDHSRLIIQELLEVLINANNTGLQISEIEGDAILFYKFGQSPSLPELYQQVEEMFCAFHSHLFSYDHKRYCFCKACNAAIGLSLKVITHYGEFTGYKVHTFNKLIGRDIIIAHQLLKNDIRDHEYWLVTNNLIPGDMPEGLQTWMNWDSSKKQTESGEVKYHYTYLAPLKSRINKEPLAADATIGMKEVAVVSREFKKNIISMFHATGDFSNRANWQEDVVAVEEVNHSLPRIGMRCRIKKKSGDMVIYSSNYKYDDLQIQFTEREEKGNECTTYLLQKITEERTKLTIKFYIPDRVPGKWMFTFSSKNEWLRNMERSFDKLELFLRSFETSPIRTPDRE